MLPYGTEHSYINWQRRRIVGSPGYLAAIREYSLQSIIHEYTFRAFQNNNCNDQHQKFHSCSPAVVTLNCRQPLHSIFQVAVMVTLNCTQPITLYFSIKLGMWSRQFELYVHDNNLKIFYVIYSTVSKGTKPTIRVFYCNSNITIVSNILTGVNTDWKSAVEE